MAGCAVAAAAAAARRPTLRLCQGVARQQMVSQQQMGLQRRWLHAGHAKRRAMLAAVDRDERKRLIDEKDFVGLTGAEIFHEMMLKHDVEQVFGYPGGAILPVFDAIYNSPFFNFVLPRHEQGGGHMAEGYARVTGKPGVCLVTSGPGATNMVTPLQDAMSDGTPLIVFSGQVPTIAMGTDAFQEADIVGITRSCTKWNVLVKSVAELPRRINEAFHIAQSGRPGPVLVDLPKDVTAMKLDSEPDAELALPQEMGRAANPRHLENQMASDEDFQRIAALINNAQRPIIYAGQGVVTGGAVAQLRELAARGNIPVTTTLLGLGAFDELDPRSLHMLGMHGSAYANYSVQDADVIVALGARFDDRVTGNVKHFAGAALRAEREGTGGIIHFEVSPKQISKVVTPTEAVIGEVRGNLDRLLPHIRAAPREEWFGRIAEWKAKFPFRFNAPSRPGDIMPQAVIQELDRQTAHMKEDVVIATGVGQHQMWAAQYFRWRHPRAMVTSGGLGTMGFGLPAAIGATIGAGPGKIVVDIDGDASFSMTGMELITAVQYNIPVKVLIINNRFQGMVRQWQDLFYDKRYSHTEMLNPDFCQLAEAMGCRGMRVDRLEDLPRVMQDFLAYNDGPVLLDAIVENDEHVYPMVPAGAALHELITERPPPPPST